MVIKKYDKKKLQDKRKEVHVPMDKDITSSKKVQEKVIVTDSNIGKS